MRLMNLEVTECEGLPFPFSSIRFDDIFVSSSTSKTSFCCKPALLAGKRLFTCYSSRPCRTLSRNTYLMKELQRLQQSTRRPTFEESNSSSMRFQRRPNRTSSFPLLRNKSDTLRRVFALRLPKWLRSPLRPDFLILGSTKENLI